MDEKLKKKVGLNGLFLALTLVVNALSAFGFIKIGRASCRERV